MSTSTPPAKKPSSNGSGSAPSTARKAPTASSTTNSQPPLSRSPSRMAASTTAGTGSNNSSSTSINRTRSVRNGAGTPMSARAAARKPAATDAGASDSDDGRAEMQSKLDELQQRLADCEQQLSTSQKQAGVLQIKLDEALKEQSLLDDQVHESTERIEELENEKRDAQRSKRELEQIFESERAASLKEREESQAREEELQRSLVRLKESSAHQKGLGHNNLGDEEQFSRRHSRPMSISRTPSFRSDTASPNAERDGGRQFAPSSSGLQRSDSRSSSQLVNQKDRVIEGLKLELAEAQIKLAELENMGGKGLQALERDMYEVKMLNARLMEENESFQLLLREKTLTGDFGSSDLLRAPSIGGEGSRPPSRQPQTGANLADELGDEAMTPATDGEPSGTDGASHSDSKERRLQGEVNSLKDQNKALTLYINNIISRLLQSEQFEMILDKTPDLMAGPGAASVKYGAPAVADTEKDLPPPPPPKDEKPPEEAQSLLQRAGSVLRGRSKPSRPMSQTLAPEQAPKLHDESQTVHENPDTAPRIPLGRSASTRGGNAHKRSISDWPAASVVTSMYKGPTPGLSGPTSPGLGSPSGTGRAGSFFPRAPSGNAVPTIDESDLDGNEKENRMPPPPPPHKDLKSPPADRNSVASVSETQLASDPSALSALTGGAEGSSNPSSPPRSTTSSGERDNRAGSGGAIMMGSKPRPLRLVQESAAAEESKKVGSNPNRGSWFGWMNKAGGAAGGLMPGRSVSGGSGAEGQQQQQ